MRGFLFAERVSELLRSRGGFEDRSDIPTAVGIARGGLRADRVADEGGLVGESLPLRSEIKSLRKG